MPELDFRLHTLGWRSFQDLCGVILQAYLGQTFTIFADSNDIGQDGGWRGAWRTAEDVEPKDLDGFQGMNSVVVQCKFSVSPVGTLTPSALEPEIEKVKKLIARGQCDAYLVMTNLGVTGKTSTWLAEELGKMGVSEARILGRPWVAQAIQQSAKLRRYVPRTYGLGDLSMILEDRRLEQTKAAITALSCDLDTFVATEAYRKAARAVADKGFAILLGEPSVGKSTIAGVLAIHLAAEQGMQVMRIDSPAEFGQFWNPNESNQLFWMDDAFGSVRHDAQRTDAWNSQILNLRAAIKGGNKVIMTSRDYIFRDAEKIFKINGLPLDGAQRVVIDVAEITEREREEILYNHLKFGDQPASFLTMLKPWLPAAASTEAFHPELARRLSFAAFTNGVEDWDERTVIAWMSNPVPFLKVAMESLAPAQLAALACVFLSGDGLEIPLTLSESMQAAISNLGAQPHEVAPALESLAGTFVGIGESTAGATVWRFHHPTIRECFAMVIAEKPSAIAVFVEGLSTDDLLRQVECGAPNARGTLVRVPPALYPTVADRVNLTTSSGPYNAVAIFLQNRTSPEFLEVWVHGHEQDLTALLKFGINFDAFWQPSLLAHLHSVGLLSEELRIKAVERITRFAAGSLEVGSLSEKVLTLFTGKELEVLRADIESSVIPELQWLIDQDVVNAPEDVESEQIRINLMDLTWGIETVLGPEKARSHEAALNDARQRIEEVVEERVEPDPDPMEDDEYRDYLADAYRDEQREAERNPFDDVADGH